MSPCSRTCASTALALTVIVTNGFDFDPVRWQIVTFFGSVVVVVGVVVVVVGVVVVVVGVVVVVVGGQYWLGDDPGGQ